MSRHNCLGVGCMKRVPVVRLRRPTVDTDAADIAVGIDMAVGRRADGIEIADKIESVDTTADRTAGWMEPCTMRTCCGTTSHMDCTGS